MAIEEISKKCPYGTREKIPGQRRKRQRSRER